MLRLLSCSLFLGFAILAGGSSVALAQSPDGGGRRKPPKVNNSKPEQKPQKREGYIRISEVAPLLAYRIKFVDIPLVAKEMQLDKGQQEILEQIVADYMERLDLERQNLLEQLMRSKEASRKDDPAWREREEQRTKVAARKSGASPAQRAASMRASMQGELSASEGTEPMVSSRSARLNVWASMHQEEWDTLMASVDVIRNPDQPGHWEAITRSLRRRNSPWRSRVHGEQVDLGKIVMLHWGRTHQIIPKISGVLMQYSMEYDEALARRDQLIGRTHPIVLDAKVYHHPGPWIRAIEQQVDARIAMSRVNEAYIELIAEAMPRQDGERFRQIALNETYPDIYMTHQFEHLVEHLRSYSKTYGLTDEQMLIIDNTEAQYYDELEPLRLRRVEAVKKAEPRRLLNAAEQEAMMKCYGLMDSLNLEDDVVFQERNALKRQYMELDAEYLERIKGVISEELFEELPAAAYRPGRGDVSRSPVKDSDPNAPVVYLKGPGEPTGSSSGRSSSAGAP